MTNFYNSFNDASRYTPDFTPGDNGMVSALFKVYENGRSHCTGYNTVVNDEMRNNENYGKELIAPQTLDAFLVTMDEASTSESVQAYNNFNSIYQKPIVDANSTSMTDSGALNKCDEVESYVDALVKKALYETANNNLANELTALNSFGTNAGYNIRHFKCRDTCYDKATHEPSMQSSVVSCPPTAPLCTVAAPFTTNTHDASGFKHIVGCSFNINLGRMTINWNDDFDNGAPSKLGWSYICAESRSPTKYTFSLTICINSYTIRKK